jgi:hypothetical protein
MMRESLTVGDNADAARRARRRRGETVVEPTGVMNAAQLLALQRTAGNAAAGVAIANTLSLQRDCGCGGACGSCGAENAEADRDNAPSDAVQRVVGDADSTVDSSDRLPDAGSIAPQ